MTEIDQTTMNRQGREKRNTVATFVLFWLDCWAKNERVAVLQTDTRMCLKKVARREIYIIQPIPQESVSCRLIS
jgi:hypothetical protein